MEGGKNYRIAKLKGAENYDTWQLEAGSLLKSDGLWLITSGRELPPNEPKEPKQSLDAAGSSATASRTIEKEWESYNEKVKVFDKEYIKWEHGNNRATALIVLTSEKGPRVHIRSLESASEMWINLKKQYGTSDLSTRNLALQRICKFSQSDYKNITEYAEELKKSATKCADMGNTIPPWMLSCFFLMGLDEGLEPYTFGLIQAAKNSNKELDIDDMVVALADHDKRHNSEETVKGLSAKFRHKSTSKTRNSERDDSKDLKCDHCKGFKHVKADCRYLHPHLRRKDWKSHSGKEKFMKENLGKQPGAEDSFKSKSTPGVRVMRSMRSSRTLRAGGTTELDDTWWIDTGADDHVCFDISQFEPGSYQKVKGASVLTADDNKLKIIGKGSIVLNILVEGTVSRIRLTNVYHVPELRYNLLSVGTVEAKGYSVRIENARFEFVHSSGDVTLSGTRAKSGGYYVDTSDNSSKIPKSSHIAQNNKASWRQWHRRLGHLDMQDVKRLATMSTGIDVDAANNLQKREFPEEVCEPCALGKQHRNPYRIPHTRAATKGELVHTDLASGGRIKQTLGGARYVAAMTDDFTDFTVVYLLKKKSEFKKVLGDYLVMMKTQGTPVQRLRSDNGGEYAGAETIFLLGNFGVEWEPTTPYNPNQNGVAERCFRTLFERARAILADSKLPANQWGEAISTITYLKNRSPTTALKGITPYQAWYGKKPDLSNLHVFGSVAYHHVEGDRRKLDDKSLRCRFLGYSEINQFRLWTGNKVIVSSYVLWDEAVVTEVGENEENEDYSFLDFDVPGTSDTNTDDDTVK